MALAQRQCRPARRRARDPERPAGEAGALFLPHARVGRELLGVRGETKRPIERRPSGQRKQELEIMLRCWIARPRLA